MRMRGHAEHDDMKYVPREHARGVGAAGPDRPLRAAPARAAASPRQSELDGDRRRRSTRQLAGGRGLRRGEPLPRARERRSPASTATATSRRPCLRSSRNGRRRKGGADGRSSPTSRPSARPCSRRWSATSASSCIGEDVGTYGGAFRVTAGLPREVRRERVIDTPISETAIVGAAIGAALMGMRPIAEMQFIDFISCGFDQIVNYAAKSRYRWGGGVPIVVRGPVRRRRARRPVPQPEPRGVLHERARASRSWRPARPRTPRA